MADASSPDTTQTLDASRTAATDADLFTDTATDSETDETHPKWEIVDCPNGSGIAEPSAALHTQRPTAYLGVYGDWSPIPGSAEPAATDGFPRVVAEVAHSTPACSNTTDRAACEHQIAVLQTSGSCSAPACWFAIVSDESKYMRIDARAELLELLGRVDSASEAVLLAAFDGISLCPGPRADTRDVGTEMRASVNGYELRVTREQCGGELYRDHLTVSTDGELILRSHLMLAPSTCAVGRRPPGLRSPSLQRSKTRIGAYLAHAALLEAASVYAFQQLLRDFAGIGAPRLLQQLALNALFDEVRHAREMGALARFYGAEVRLPDIVPSAPRSLIEVARDNVSEGCVRETFGALIATFQAETAREPRVRRVMNRIARDETRHAALSWKLMAWIAPQLSMRERRELVVERERALRTLADELDAGLSDEECRELGYPEPSAAEHLLERASRALWS